MALEMIGVNSMDTGRYKAVVIQDEGDKQAIKGFIKIAHVLSAGTIAGSGKHDGSLHGQLNLDKLDGLCDVIATFSGLKAEFVGTITYDDERLLEIPIILPQGEPNEAEMDNLARYLMGGGFVIGSYWPEALIKYGGLIEGHDLSPVTLTEAFLKRIEDVNPKLNAYVTVTGERALDDARAAEQEIANGIYKGPLHGIPIALKDIYDTAGIRTTSQSHLHISRTPTRDSQTAALLRAAGTVMLGKLTTHEFAFAGPAWDLPFPPALNPWNTDYFTGGSSSGSGAATAAGLAMATLGSDTAGSIRMPAFFCGISGLKPTYGRVSRRGVSPLAYSLDHCGPMTWSARDAALMLQVISGYDTEDPASCNCPVPDYASALTGEIKGVKVGLIRHFYDGDEHADAEVKAAMDEMLHTLQELGAEIEEIQLSNLHDYSACCLIIMLCEALAIHEHDLKATPQKYSEIFRDRLMVSSLLTGIDYVQAVRLRRQLTTEIEDVLTCFDVLLTAGGFAPAPKLEEVSKFYVMQKPLLTAPFDVTGSPAIGVRNGFSAEGLPIGAQIVGRAFDEATVLRVADAYEQATDWRKQRPSL